MPLIECLLIKGYDSDTRRIVSERLTDAACSAIGADPEFVHVSSGATSLQEAVCSGSLELVEMLLPYIKSNDFINQSNL